MAQRKFLFIGKGGEGSETTMSLVCGGNYYLCKIKHRCDDAPECHALARAVIGSEVDRFRRCQVVYDGGVFRYEFEMLPTYDFTSALRKQKLKRLQAWRKRIGKR